MRLARRGGNQGCDWLGEVGFKGCDWLGEVGC